MMIEFTISIGDIFKSGELDNPDNTLEKLLGRKPETVEEYLGSVIKNKEK